MAGLNPQSLLQILDGFLPGWTPFVCCHVASAAVDATRRSGLLAAHKMLTRFLRTLLSTVVAPGSGPAVLRGVVPPVAPEALWRVPDKGSHGQHSTQRDPEGVLRFLLRHERNGSGGGIPLEEFGDLRHPECFCDKF